MLPQGNREEAKGERIAGGVRKGAQAALRCRFAFLLLTLSISPSATGCAGLWDEVTRRDFHMQNLFSKPDPLVVLRDSTDGDERAKALRALHEPKQYGGSDADQEAIVKVLTTAAATERQPLCRLAAIQSLGRFQDPRAAQGLINAFESADSFPPETATVVRCQALAALGQTGNPAAVPLLVRVVGQPPTKGSEQEKQQTLDERIAAARALQNFNSPQSTEALVRVLRTEKDVALRDRAHEALQTATGKKLPPDDKGWDELVSQPNSGVIQAGGKSAGEPIWLRKLLDWF
jgi:hypothetical protein